MVYIYIVQIMNKKYENIINLIIQFLNKCEAICVRSNLIIGENKLQLTTLNSHERCTLALSMVGVCRLTAYLNLK